LSEHVAKFLAKFKGIVETDGLHIIPRPSHNKTILELGLTRSMVKEMILNLTVKHYNKGPMADRDYPGTGDLYVFKAVIDGVTLYIKLKIDISDKSGKQIAKCISFHA
jgi:hypothetical protein